jgi:DNA-binding CsgD family transcriptional regulator
VTLDTDLARKWWDEGRALDPDEALELIPDVDSIGTLREMRPGGLSPREVDVLRLLAQGHTDREIASLLFISPRTVQNHIQNVFGKVHVSSRSGATRWAIQKGIA